MTAGGKSFAGVKTQKGIFQGDVVSRLLFVIPMMLLNHVLRKCTGEYKLTKSQVKINHQMYLDDIKQFSYEKELETLTQAVRIYNQDIGMEFGIDKCAMLIMRGGKRQMTEGI